MTGIKALDIILGSLNILVLLGALGTFVYTNNFMERPLIKDLEEFEKLVEEQRQDNKASYFEMDKINMNLPSSRTKLRYLSVKANILPFKEKDTSYLEDHKAVLSDILIAVGGDMDPDELRSVSGKLIFESRIKARFRTVSKRAVIKRIDFSLFVVQ